MKLRAMKHLTRTLAVLFCGLLLWPLTSCRFDPPLHLADAGNVEVTMPEVLFDIDMVWNLDVDWHEQWWYGWDETDRRLWGDIKYPQPTNYEVRLYYRGQDAEGPTLRLGELTVYENSFRHRFDVGYNDLLVWSNIDSKDGTQTVLIDESDKEHIKATTTKTRVSFLLPTRSTELYKNPDIFYNTYIKSLLLTNNPDDYDYYDEERQVYVKEVRGELAPLVYMYMVQVVIYNNKGRITGLTDNAVVSSLAQGASVHTGRTTDKDIAVSFEMRLKKDLTTPAGKQADIFGGKLTTFGLCGMEQWKPTTRSSRYEGTRTDLRNHLSLSLQFSNQRDSAYHYDLTEQMRRQCHGGVLTIEIDADTLKIPQTQHGSGSMFDPTVAPSDSTVTDWGV